MAVTRHTSAIEVKFIACALMLLTLSTGCASNDYETPYSYNPFYTGDVAAPVHPPKAHTDFFDKVCTPSGSSSGSTGQDYSCHYED